MIAPIAWLRARILCAQSRDIISGLPALPAPSVLPSLEGGEAYVSVAGQEMGGVTCIRRMLRDAK